MQPSLSLIAYFSNFFLFVVTCWMFVLLPLTLQSFSRPILLLTNLSSQDAISKPYCIFFYFFLFVVTCWMFVLLPLTLRSFNQPILFISKWSPHAAKSMSPCMFYDYVPFVLACWMFVFSATDSSKFQPARYFSYPNRAPMTPFLGLIAYFSTSSSLLRDVEFLLFCHSFFAVSTGRNFSFPNEAIMLPFLCFIAYFFFFLLLLTCWVLVILPLTLPSFNRPITFISKWSPHVDISMPHCRFFLLLSLCFDLLNVLLFCHSFSKF